MAHEKSTHSPEHFAQIRAKEFLLLAEQLFGPMTSPWRYTGVTFRDHSPHLFYAPDDGSVQISLSLRALNDDMQRDFQLSHEICHLLYPSVERNNPVTPRTTTLNEGISTYFSIVVLAEHHGLEAAETALRSLAEYSPKYFSAFQITSKLLASDKNAVKRLRAIQPMINNVTAADFAAAGLSISDEQAAALLSIC